MIWLILYGTIVAASLLMGAKGAIQAPTPRLRRLYWQVVILCSILWPVTLAAYSVLALVEAIIDYAEGHADG
jgi:hypothetical protein